MIGELIVNTSSKMLRLTQHEIRVLKQYIRCGTAKSTATSLCVSRRTVEMHIARIGYKLGFRHIAQIVAFAYDDDLLIKGDGPQRGDMKIP